MSRRPLLLHYLLVFVVLVLPGCGDPPAMPVRIGTSVWIGYEPLYLARELSALDSTVARLVEYTSASDVLSAMRGGAIEGATLTLDEALLLAQDSLEITVVLVLDTSNGADSLLARAPLADMKQLKDKRVGVENSAVGAFLLSSALEAHGLTLDDIVAVSLAADQHEPAFRDGRVDAIVTYEPVRSRLLAQGARELFSSADVPGNIVDVLVLRNDALTRRPGLTQHLWQAWQRALEALAARPDASHHLMQPRLRLDAAQIKQSLALIRLPGRAENCMLLGGAAPPLLVTARRVANTLTRYQLWRAPANPARLLAKTAAIVAPLCVGDGA